MDCFLLSCSLRHFETQGLLLRDFFFANSDRQLISVIEKLHRNKEPQEITVDVEYDFNALFIGPAKLLAAPYASVYLDKNKLLMADSTLSVRNFMQHYGIGIANDIGIPDDHISYEIELIILLLQKSQEDEHFFCIKTILQ